MGKEDLNRVDELRHIYYATEAKYDGLNYASDEAIRHLAKYGDTRVPGFGNPYYSDEQKEKVLSLVRTWIDNHKEEESWIGDLARFELKALTKWYGPQGATPTSDEVMSVLANYYEKRVNFHIRYQLSAETKMVFRRQLSIKAWHWLKPTELFRRYRGERKSNSGVTGWTDRRTPGLAARAISEATKDPLRVDPIVTGTRDQRSKKPCRCIFMDSFANYFREVQAYSVFEAALKQSDLAAWRGDRYVEQSFYEFARSAKSLLFAEFDYEMMDSWCEDEHINWTLDQLALFIDMPENLREYQRKFTRRLFTGPLWTPKGEIAKPHTLLSGIYPTNPFETPFNILVQLSFINDVLAKMLGRALIYGVDYILVVLGDDSLIVFRNGCVDSLKERIGSLFATWVWQNFHIKANAEKQRVSNTSGFFCKRQYKLGGAQYSPFVDSTATFPKSLYPLSLACLSIFEPEDGALSTKAQSLIKIFQVFDNAWGHPIWKMILRKIWEISPELHFQVTEEDVREFNTTTNKNWRLIVLGEEFSLQKSPTAQIWAEWSK